MSKLKELLKNSESDNSQVAEVEIEVLTEIVESEMNTISGGLECFGSDHRKDIGDEAP